MASLSDRPTAPVIAWSSNGLRVLPHHQAAAHHHAADQGAIAAAPQQQQQRPQQLRGDRIILSQSALDGILRASSAAGGTALPSPLVFAITNPANLRKVYGSVREFTAPFDDAVFLSSELREALDIRIDDEEMVDADDGGGPVVNVSLVSTLPKCEYLRMAPMEPEYLELPDLRSLLESHIRQSRAVISLGDTLTVSQPSKRGAPPSEYHFLVTDIKPNQTCICVDVDVSLDVVPDDEVATEAVKRKFLAQPQPDGAAVIPFDLQKTVWRKFKPGAERFFKIELSPATGDCDLFVSKSIERPTKQDHDYVNVDQGKSSIIIELDDPPAPFVFISVRGYSTKSTFTLSAASIKAGPPLPSAPSSSGPHDPDLAPDQVLCGNCLSPISAKAAVMHEAFCRRNNAVCHRCRGLGLPHVMKKEDLPLHWHCDDCDKFCATSANPSLTTTPLDPTTAAVHTVALLKKSFLYNPKSPSYSLCVADEASATRRKAAAHLVGLGFRVSGA
ncbi:ubiquitin fusion degradation protein UFD1-domain-containing protein [Zopfochytrium polystomum]|nr:ubiquitin fusion degradation protein UFD1-domain-containing protein [Zopfochytrium polystomum]